jgi:N-acylglucosamine-6-phosphate 2-epimerase/N-acetylmuramic acid 6-phosphate etherase
MAAMAGAAEAGGAVGLRVNGPDDVRAVRAASRLPIIGLYKRAYAGSPVEITPTFAEAAAVAEAGADIIALDATGRVRPDGSSLEALIARIHAELRLPVLADCATPDDALAAEALGADAVASTLSGYLDRAVPPPEDPDLEMILRLAPRCAVPVIAEGRFKDPGQVAAALRAGAHAVVVGTAITNPGEITRWFARATKPESR